MNDSLKNNSCSFESCQSCNINTCLTGKVARENDKETYNEFINMLDEARQDELEM